MNYPLTSIACKKVQILNSRATSFPAISGLRKDTCILYDESQIRYSGDGGKFMEDKSWRYDNCILMHESAHSSPRTYDTDRVNQG